MSQIPTTLGPASLGFSFAGPLAIGFAVLGVLSARKQNKFLRAQALSAFKSLDKQITQVRIKAVDDAMILSTQAQMEAGRAEVAFGGVTGNSPSTILASFAADVASDTAVIHRNREFTLDAISAKKEDIANQANSQMKNPLVAGLLSALGGYQAGASIDDAIAQAGRLSAMKVAEQRLGVIAGQTGTMNLLTAMMFQDNSSKLLATRLDIWQRIASGVEALRSSVKSVGN